MNELEKVVQVSEKTGVSYEAAKNALEANQWNELDAIIAIEREQKEMNENNNAKQAKEEQKVTVLCGSVEGADHMDQNENSNKSQKQEKRSENKEKAKGIFTKVIEECKHLVKRSVECSFVISKNGVKKLDVPVLLLVVCLLAFFWITFPALIIGLFFDLKYSFEGMNCQKVDLNDVCDKAADVCGNVKKEFEA